MSVKWYVSENHTEEARLLLAHRIERHAPDILLAEFANTVWKKARRNEVPDPRAYFDELPFLRQVVDLHAGADHIQRAARIALEIDHPVYDCLYLACAEATGSTLITADRKLAGKAANLSPGIKVAHIAEQAVVDRICAAATALVIAREKIEALVAAHDRLAQTDEHVRSSRTDAETESASIAREDQLRILNSPAGKRLRELCLELNDEERIDLLALGWLGQGDSGTKWRPIFERACTAIDGYAYHDRRYETKPRSLLATRLQAPDGRFHLKGQNGPPINSSLRPAFGNHHGRTHGWQHP